MIQNLPPYKSPKMDFEDGKAKHDFTVMIVGFGKMGQTALKHLIMNGQFVGSNMKAIIVDKDKDTDNEKKHVERLFRYRYPTIEKLCCELEFHFLTIPCQDFFDLINEKLDYIVLALNDDETNKQTALEVDLIYKRKGMTLPMIALIGDYENRDSVPFNENRENVKIFGSREDIYQESEIINHEIDSMAKLVNDVYEETRMSDPSQNQTKIEWENLSLHKQASNRAVADFIDAMLVLANITEYEAINKNELTTNRELVEILAETEHRRWNAFHAVSGWVYDKAGKNPQAKIHNCLIEWNEVDEGTKVYDREITQNIPKYLKRKHNIKQ
jgi:hypothetical protein